MRKKELKNLQKNIEYVDRTLRKRVEEFGEKIREIDKLRNQMQCDWTMGHEFVYQKRVDLDSNPYGISYWVFGLRTTDGPFLFKCKHCGLEIKKTRDQLFELETSALVELGIIEPMKEEKEEETE